MASAKADLVQTALDAARSGDLGPLVELLGPDLVWRGISRGPSVVEERAQLSWAG